MKLLIIQAEISLLDNNLKNLEPTDNVSTVVLLWAVQQLIAKSERRFKDNNSENIYRLLLLLKYMVQTRSASQQLKQEKDCKQDNKVIIPKYADLNVQDDSAIKTEAETAITAAIDKEFQGNIEIDFTDENVDADFEKNINNAVETVNKIIHEMSSDISLSSMDKDTRKVLLEEFTKNAVNIEILFVEKHRSNNRLIADAEHLEHLKISDDDDDNKDSVKNTGETLFKLNYTFNTTGAEAPDYLTTCSDLNVNSVANLTLKSWQVTGVAWKLTQELSPVRDEILANKCMYLSSNDLAVQHETLDAAVQLDGPPGVFGDMLQQLHRKLDWLTENFFECVILDKEHKVKNSRTSVHKAIALISRDYI
ncbi:uncharacterized protein CIMG_12590 [Coccidioides immitis RS]|uniref:Uncharacterized protein n=1 Tax=Coccidioides immitis (strain RS) TaxID=246410 RepID=A0A0D8JRK9_COCIM|nr:uncharacterized protein CIMG_12590 [Coccidioides immitis RS]KJF59927.1 hypothetical protein CIMG_12590 [Coccidioides immitis RS]